MKQQRYSTSQSACCRTCYARDILRSVRIWGSVAIAFAASASHASAQGSALVVCGQGPAPTTSPQVVAFPIPETTRLCWSQDPENTTRYEIRVDGVKVQDVGPPTAPAGTVAHMGVKFPAMPVGLHTVIVSACGQTCMDSAPTQFDVRQMSAPAPTEVTWGRNTLSWKHRGENTALYEVLVDNGQTAKISVGVAAGQETQSTTVTLDVTKPHTIQVRACTQATSGTPATCTDSEPLKTPVRPEAVRLGQGG